MPGDCLPKKMAADAAKNIADFGDIKVLNGRFGPYVTDGTKNAKIAKDVDPKTLTEEQARKILTEAPAAKGRFKKRATARSSSSTKSPTAASKKSKSAKSLSVKTTKPKTPRKTSKTK